MAVFSTPCWCTLTLESIHHIKALATVNTGWALTLIYICKSKYYRQLTKPAKLKQNSSLGEYFNITSRHPIGITFPISHNGKAPLKTLENLFTWHNSFFKQWTNFYHAQTSRAADFPRQINCSINKFDDPSNVMMNLPLSFVAKLRSCWIELYHNVFIDILYLE